MPGTSPCAAFVKRLLLLGLTGALDRGVLALQQTSCCYNFSTSVVGGAGLWTLLPAVALQASQLDDARSLLLATAAGSDYEGWMQLRFSGVGDGTAPIRQSLADASAEDSMRQGAALLSLKKGRYGCLLRAWHP